MSPVPIAALGRLQCLVSAAAPAGAPEDDDRSQGLFGGKTPGRREVLDKYDFIHSGVAVPPPAVPASEAAAP